MTSHIAADSAAAAHTTRLQQLRFCFYGAGSMAEAVARGMKERSLCPPEQIGMFNRSGGPRLEELRNRYGVSTAESPEDKAKMLSDADVIVLSMKPKDAEEAIRAVSGIFHEGQLIVSMIAGLSIRTIQALIGKPLPVVRTMPNTSSSIGLGATGISFSSDASEEQRMIGEQLFRSVGLTVTVDEPLLEAVTGVSGSGPAYLYYIMESMIQAGVELGLDSGLSRELTVQTMLGAAEMMRVTGEEPAELRRRVTSPGGTTQAAIALMEEHGVGQHFRSGMKRSAERAAEIGRDLERSVLGDKA
ncbi:pyrroline-5-carboxylate reductase [Paenibacillus pasadenensis]|uniref:pyrroline-5-carboxylate reductase n=1 Tax=Paenibacillus pasadenensis TaxID=217090 RepID=UPI002040DDC9|nr:pyrroline-5-carboxylate reductase [Paenibacillus pasadenensis]MCM3747535.1 pyrroline-5-carboxylate reductase [Paenibacillus pasadenensis]